MKLFRMTTVTVASLALLAGCPDDPVTSGTPDGAADSTVTTDAGDAGTSDTGTPDAVTPDTVTTDAGTPDAVTPDTGTPDTGTPDTSTPDTSTPDTSQDIAACNITFADEVTRVNVASLPGTMADYQCDSNDDGTIDDADGELNGLLGSLSSFVDVNAELGASVEDGSLILLAEFAGYAGADATGVTTNLLIGSDISEQPDPTCGVGAGNLDAVCDWDVDPSSYENCAPVVTVPGCTVSGGELDCGPANFQFSLPLGGLSLTLDITDGRFKGGLATGAVMTDGRLCGSVPKSAITDAVDAACAVDPPPEFCSFAGAIGLILNCGSDDICTIVLELG